MIAVTFHTGIGYDAYAEGLATSAKRVGVDLKVFERQDRKSWVANVNQKPEVILYALERWRTDVLWVDADSKFIEFPTEMYRAVPDADAWLFDHNGYLWGSTMLFRYSPMGLELVRQWGAQCRLTPEFSSDSNLTHVLKDGGSRYLIGALPQSYVDISSPGEWGLAPVKGTVIWHFGKMNGRDRGQFMRNESLESPW